MGQMRKQVCEADNVLGGVAVADDEMFLFFRPNFAILEALKK